MYPVDLMKVRLLGFPPPASPAAVRLTDIEHPDPNANHKSLGRWPLQWPFTCGVHNLPVRRHPDAVARHDQRDSRRRCVLFIGNIEMEQKTLT